MSKHFDSQRKRIKQKNGKEEEEGKETKKYFQCIRVAPKNMHYICYLELHKL